MLGSGPTILTSDNLEINNPVLTRDIFGPKIQILSFNLKAFTLIDNSIKKKETSVISNEQDLKNNFIQHSDRKVKKINKGNFGNISLLKNIRLAAKKFKRGMSAKPVYDLNQKIINMIYDYTISKLPRLRFKPKRTKKYIENEILILKSIFLFIFFSLKGYIQEKFEAIPIIKPENKMKLIWDFFIIFIIFSLFFIYPIQMSFNLKTFLLNDSSKDSMILQGWLSIILTSVLGTDIILKFFSAYYEKDLSTFISVGIELHCLLGYNNDENLLLIITSKIFQSFIFLRLVDVNKYLCLIEEIIYLGHKGIAFFHLFKLAVSIFFFSHIMGCLWHVVSYYGPYERSILKNTNFYYVEWTSRYLRCLFFTINPGRVDPQNELELAFGYFALLASSGSIGFMISSIQTITRTFNKNEETKRDSKRIINGYMKKKGIAFDYQNRIRKYLDSLYDDENNKRIIEQKLIDQLSISLKKELLIKSHGEIIEKYDFFKNNFSDETLKKITLALKNKNYSPEEILIKGKEDDMSDRSLFFVVEGEISVYYNKNNEEKSIYTIRKGDLFNEYTFITAQKSPFYVKTLTHAALLKLSYPDFISILKENSKDYQKFCMLRDKIMLNNSVFFLSAECRGCGLKDHLLENCEKLHLVLNKGIKIKQHLLSQPMIERKRFSRKKKKFNSLKILNECITSFSEWEEPIIQDEENEESTESVGKKSEFEIEAISKKEINTSFISKNEKNEPGKEGNVANLKKEPIFLSNMPNHTNLSKENRSNKLQTEEEAELNLDKLQNYLYFYPDFNFENIRNRLLSVRKMKMGTLREKRRKGVSFN